MPELPTNILTSLTNLPHAPQLAKAYLQPLDLAPGERPPWTVGSRPNDSAVAFQYWPETIQDSRGSEWNAKPIPGGSHPIYQWTHGGERRISFTAMFTTDTAPEESELGPVSRGVLDERLFPTAGGLLEPGDLGGVPYEREGNPLSGIELGTRDVDLRAVVSWLRWYTYPYYDEEAGWKAIEPAKCLLVMPNMGLGFGGYDHITCVMTQCDVTYEACFESGFPRLIEVSLEFAEVVQEGSRVRFHSRADIGYAASIARFLGLRDDRR